MDPATAATVGIGTNILGGVVGAAGKLEAGAATATELNYQAAVAQMNSQIAQNMSTREIMAGGIEAEKVGMQVAQARGQQRAGFGAGNIAGATPSRVESSTTQVGQWQQQITGANAMGKAYRLQVQGAEDIAQSNLEKIGATQATTAGDIGAVGSIIGGVAGTGTKIAQFGQSFGGSSSFNAPS